MIVANHPRVNKDWSPCGRRENWQDYYVPREASADYSAYWGEKTDPDGNVRQRNTAAERERYLSDVSEELAFINNLKPVSVLDFGAGLGWMLSAIDAPHKSAIEIAPEAMAVLRQTGAVVNSDIRQVPSNSNDVVICHHVIEHLVDPVAEIGQLRRVLHSGGWLVIGTPDFGSPCAVRFGENYRLLHDPTHRSLFTLEGLMRMLREYGLTIHDVRFPFPERYATTDNFARWNDTSKVSPPWPGNFVTVYATRN